MTNVVPLRPLLPADEQKPPGWLFEETIFIDPVSPPTNPIPLQAIIDGSAGPAPRPLPRRSKRRMDRCRQHDWTLALGASAIAYLLGVLHASLIGSGWLF